MWDGNLHQGLPPNLVAELPSAEEYWAAVSLAVDDSVPMLDARAVKADFQLARSCCIAASTAGSAPLRLRRDDRLAPTAAAVDELLLSLPASASIAPISALMESATLAWSPSRKDKQRTKK